jgi:hypothetical protein
LVLVPAQRAAKAARDTVKTLCQFLRRCLAPTPLFCSLCGEARIAVSPVAASEITKSLIMQPSVVASKFAPDCHTARTARNKISHKIATRPKPHQGESTVCHHALPTSFSASFPTLLIPASAPTLIFENPGLLNEPTGSR